ncbi:hypothetical protein ONS95_011085 [Cadophora gregata]|uniref:uncharacterized protein n=1 Tax=Cadophora gregata TaxID=51156 RepID=UPI0026DD6BC0|nr:uncharacterized protein ONS95_011085 [Cadophora gregata]KAK0119647.1 hypothetical protein ONS95_011085 [Cadophora gregata]
MSPFCFPFRSFPDQCYCLEGRTHQEDLTIKDLKPVDYDYWLQDEKERLYWQFHHLKESRKEKTNVTATQGTPTSHSATTEQTTAIFHLFSALPTEIRLKIFSFISGGYQRPRVHRINNRPDTPLEFISNQDMSPLLHICCESRNEYLKRSESVFAFETYVNHSRDIFYFMDTNGPGDFQRLAMFFNHEEAKLIQKVALRQALFQHVSHLIPESMNEVEEVMIVFEEWNGWEEKWDGGEVKFVRSGNGKKKKPMHDGDEVRSDVKTMIQGIAHRRLQNGGWLTVNQGKKIRLFVGIVEKLL